MADKRNLCCFDFETTGTDATICEPFQLGAVIIDRQSLKEKDSFFTFIKTQEPIPDDVIKLTHTTPDQLEGAPSPKVALALFANWIKKHHIKHQKGLFAAPIPCGWGINRFDLPILNRICQEAGFWHKERKHQTILNPVFSFDAGQIIWWLTMNNMELPSLRLGDVLKYMGMDKDEVDHGAHNALWDAQQTGKIVTKLLKLSSFLSNTAEGKDHPRLQLANCLLETSDDIAS